MADSMCCNIDILSQLDDCGIEELVDVVIPALDTMYDHCCYGTTTVEGVISNPESVTNEAFPDGVGTLNCNCPILYVTDSNDVLYYSLDGGDSYTIMSPSASCYFQVGVTGSVDINDYDVSSEQGYIDAVNAGCNVIFAVAENGRTFVISPLLKAGDGTPDEGEWCDICSGITEPQFVAFSETFECTGADQYITAPTGAVKATLKMWGAGGAQGCYDNCTQVDAGSRGGAGAYSEISVDVNSGYRMTLRVGCGGGQHNDSSLAGAFGEGGAIGTFSTRKGQGGGGGGYSAMWYDHIPKPAGASYGAFVGGGGGGSAAFDGSLCTDAGESGSTQTASSGNDSGTPSQCEFCGAGGGGNNGGNARNVSCGGSENYGRGYGGETAFGASPVPYDEVEITSVDSTAPNSADPDRPANVGEGGCHSCGTGLMASSGFRSNGGNGAIVVYWE